jgi:hypothetical protein
LAGGGIPPQILGKNKKIFQILIPIINSVKRKFYFKYFRAISKN